MLKQLLLVSYIFTSPLFLLYLQGFSGSLSVALHHFYTIFSFNYIGFYIRIPDSFQIALQLDQGIHLLHGHIYPLWF